LQELEKQKSFKIGKTFQKLSLKQMQLKIKFFVYKIFVLPFFQPLNYKNDLHTI
jgi:hypothetical protein